MHLQTRFIIDFWEKWGDVLAETSWSLLHFARKHIATKKAVDFSLEWIHSVLTENGQNIKKHLLECCQVYRGLICMKTSVVYICATHMLKAVLGKTKVKWKGEKRSKKSSSQLCSYEDPKRLWWDSTALHALVHCLGYRTEHTDVEEAVEKTDILYGVVFTQYSWR